VAKTSASSKHVVFVDADNTLWDTDGVFASAQLNLLAAVERALGTGSPANDRLALVRQVDQALAERHHLGLRYPPRLLALALGRVLRGDLPDSAAKAVWKGTQVRSILATEQAKVIEDQFIADTRSLPQLLPGVRDGLMRLHAAGMLILVLTEGARLRALRSAEAHHLTSLFDRIVEAPKTVQLFERVLRLPRTSRPGFMIGDQLQRDIAPAKAAGLVTIYVPGRFRPRWEPDETLVGPTFRAERFDEAVDLILTPAADLHSSSAAEGRH